jgi:hypothetical protein
MYRVSWGSYMVLADFAFMRVFVTELWVHTCVGWGRCPCLPPRIDIEQQHSCGGAGLYTHSHKRGFP